MPVEKESGFILDGKLHTYKYMEPTVEENLQSLEKFPLFIATIDYFATGEGRSMYILIKRAATEEEFIDWASDASDAYYMSGATIYKNEYPTKDNVVAVLLPSRMESMLRSILLGEQESGHFVYTTRSYMNFS